jgi:hypothetical protein
VSWLSKPTHKILSSFTVVQGPIDSIDIRVDYPEVFVVIPLSQPWSDDVSSKNVQVGNRGCRLSPGTGFEGMP